MIDNNRIGTCTSFSGPCGVSPSKVRLSPACMWYSWLPCRYTSSPSSKCRNSVPGWAKVVGRDNDRVEDLRVRLEEAVAAERYEEAGRLRDEIRQLTPPETAV